MSNRAFFIIGLFLTCICNVSITQDNPCYYSQILSSPGMSLPERYHTLEYFKIYALFQASPLKDKSVVMVQFYKDCVYNKNYLKRWPKELVWQVFDYCLNSSFFLISVKDFEKPVDAPQIRQKFINSLLPEKFISFDIVPSDNQINSIQDFENRDFRENQNSFIFEYVNCLDWVIRITKKNAENVKEEDIEDIKKSGLLFACDKSLRFKEENENFYEMAFDDWAVYNIFKSFNSDLRLCLSRNKRYDFFIQQIPLRSVWGNVYYEYNYIKVASDDYKSSLLIYDKNDKSKVVQKFQFDDYIRASFCTGKFLIVELIDEVIEYSYSYTQPIHKKDAQPPCNHRIEIYSIDTKKKLYEICFPLCIPYKFNTFLYSLFYVDPQNIYVYDHKNTRYSALPYKNYSVVDVMNSSDDFFVRQKALKHNLKHVALDDNNRKESIQKNLVQNFSLLFQKRIDDRSLFYMTRLLLLFWFYSYFGTIDR